MEEEEKQHFIDEPKPKQVLVNSLGHVRKTSSDKFISADPKPKEPESAADTSLVLHKPKKTETNFKQYDTFEFEDPSLGKIRMKTKVLESSAKLKVAKKKSNRVPFQHIHNILRNSNIPIRHLNFDEFEGEKCDCDLKQFYWDNLDTYYNKKAKIAIKENIDKGKRPTVSFAKMISEIIGKSIQERVDFNKVGKYSMLLVATLLIQAIVNKKIKHWSFTLLSFISYVFTSVGISSTLYFVFLKERGNQRLDDGKSAKENFLFKSLKAKVT